MQVSKAAVVATGALAAAAAMGSTPAFAADSEGAPAVTPATVGLIEYDAKHRASDEAMRELAEQWFTVAPEQMSPAPWDREPRQILSLGTGSVFSVAPSQQCASGSGLLGITAPMSSAHTVLDDCRNGNIDIANGGNNNDAMFSILDGSVVSALAHQQCASGVGLLGLHAPMDSPHTVGGGCDNANIKVGDEPDDSDDPDYDDPYYPGAADDTNATVRAVSTGSAREEQTVVPEQMPWEAEPRRILSADGGSALSALARQQCAAGAGAAGVAAPISSDHTVLDDCRNGNIDINGEPADVLFSLLDFSATSVAASQQCASGVRTVGVHAPIDSHHTVNGKCDNANIVIR